FIPRPSRVFRLWWLLPQPIPGLPAGSNSWRQFQQIPGVIRTFIALPVKRTPPSTICTRPARIEFPTPRTTTGDNSGWLFLFLVRGRHVWRRRCRSWISLDHSALTDLARLSSFPALLVCWWQGRYRRRLDVRLWGRRHSGRVKRRLRVHLRLIRIRP